MGFLGPIGPIKIAGEHLAVKNLPHNRFTTNREKVLYHFIMIFYHDRPKCSFYGK